MEGAVYRRPLLCRLCECPVVDRGVRLSKHNIEKVSRWWKAHFDTDLELEKSCIVCYFCVWDLRYANQHSEDKEPADQVWWPIFKLKNNEHHNRDKYYYDGWMKPCSVKIAPLENEDKLLEKYEQPGIGLRHRCLFCPQNYATYQRLILHAKTVHPEDFIHCNKRSCGKLFRTEEEKAEHTKKEHQAKKKPRNCVYCGKICINYETLKAHLLKEHKNQIIRCKYKPCIKYFKTTEERDKHFSENHSSGKYFCCFCDRYFKNNSSQWEHMKIYHKEEALKCNAVRSCPNYFKTEEDRHKHVQEKHDSKKYKCLYCKATYSQKGALATHIRVFHSDVALKCEYHFRCSTWFKTEEERQKHYEEKHENGDKVLCPFCNKKVSKLGGIRTHFRTHHGKEKIIKCDYTFFCANYFKNEEDKLKHVQEVHEIHDEKFRCVYCEKLIPKAMYHHINAWHKDVAIKCNFHEKCPTFFKTLEDRDKHVREMHQAEKIREAAPCLYCDLILVSKHNLVTHIQLRHPEMAIKCPQCGTFFKSQEDLEKHFSSIPNHKQPLKKKQLRLVEPLSCALCKKSFHYKYALRQHIICKHIRIQTKEICPHCKKPTSSKRNHVVSDFCKVCNKKFQCLGLLKSHTLKCKVAIRCSICSKSFKIQSQLNYHCKLIHTVPILKWRGLENKSRGFKCDECLIYFRSKLSLQSHNSRSHASNVCLCDFCNKQFSCKENLKDHLSRLHLGLKKFVHCPICNLKMVKHKHRQMKHAETHLKQEKVACEFCAKMIVPSGLNYHLKMFH